MYQPPQLCVTVTGRTMDELRHARDAVEDADLIELRLDAVERPDVAGALEGRRRPVIVTCRPTWEGGAFEGSEEERSRLLRTAARLGAEFVDVEAGAAFAGEMLRERGGRGLVLSVHTFGEPPGDLGARYDALRSTGAEVVKLAAEVRRLSDVLPLVAIADRTGTEPGDRRHVLVAMGAAGIVSRVCAARLGNRWTYAGDGVAPGQLPPSRLLREFRFRRIRSDTALYGVVGNAVERSRSPVMHNAGFAALGLNAAYVPLQAHDAADFVQFARALGVRGASITAPYKVALMDHLDQVEPLARRVGAVNTLVICDGRWIGTNTDVEGFLRPLKERVRLNGVRAAVLGAGGAARAVAVALVEEGAAVTICARRQESARQVAELARAEVGEFPPPPGTWDLLVNATPAGSVGHPVNPMAGTPLDGQVVFDLVYAPAETPLLAAARAAGCRTIGGLEMLIAQAERQFELWTGQPPPAGLFASVATE